MVSNTLNSTDACKAGCVSRIHPVVAVAKPFLLRHCDIIVNGLTAAIKIILHVKGSLKKSFPFRAGYDVFMFKEQNDPHEQCNSDATFWLLCWFSEQRLTENICVAVFVLSFFHLVSLTHSIVFPFPRSYVFLLIFHVCSPSL